MCSVCKVARITNIVFRAGTEIPPNTPEEFQAMVFGSLFTIHDTLKSMLLRSGDVDAARTHQDLAEYMINRLEKMLPDAPE